MSRQNLDLTCAKIQQVWAEAAAGSVSIVWAAWLTTAAVDSLRHRFDGGSFSVSLQAADHGDLCQRYASLLGIDGRESGGVARILARDSAQSGVFSSGRGLLWPAEAIIRGASTRLEGGARGRVVFEDPEDYVTAEDGGVDRRGQYGAEGTLMDKLLDGMKRRLLPSEEIRTEFLYRMNPLIKDVANIYRRPEDNSIAPNASMQTDLVFDLQLLVESYKSFMITDGTTPKTVNCRVQMLRFAQDVKNTLAKLRELRPWIHEKCCDYLCTTQGLSSSIWTLELDLMVLTGQKIFDLYYQAPWVAGSQMLETLSRATTFGVQLCNKNHIVWAVLHLYNLLRQCGALNEETVLLQHLCSAFGKQVFRGDPPRRDFSTRYKVCNGGRIEFDRSRRHHSRQHQSSSSSSEGDKPCAPSARNWRVTMPTSHAGFANDSHELHPHHHSVFAGLYTCGFRPSCLAWPWAWHGTDRSRLATEQVGDRVADEIAAHPFVCALDHLEGTLGSELQGDFPPGRVNWFAVFLTVTEILGEMGQAQPVGCSECRKAPRDSDFWVGRGCVAVQRLMSRADEFEDVGRSEFRSEYLCMVEPARNAICSAVRGKGGLVRDSCWLCD